MEVNNINKPERILGLDILRIISIFSVVFFHLAAQYWGDITPRGLSWQALNIYRSLTVFVVPAMLMVSGVTFLDPDRPMTMKKLLSKYVWRLAIIYIFWTCFYGIVACCYHLSEFTSPLDGLKFFILYCLKGVVHLWYLPMLIGVYFLVPIFRAVTCHKNAKKILQYLLILLFAFQILVPSILNYSFPYKEHIQSILKIIPFPLGLYPYYFILGYYLYQYPPPKSQKAVFGCLGLLSAALCWVPSAYVSFSMDKSSSLIGNNSVMTCLICIALFIFILPHQFKKGDKFKKGIIKASGYMLGVYLLHPFYITLFAKAGIDTYKLCPTVFSVPILSVIIFILCIVTIFLLTRIPGVRKVCW